MTTMLRPGEMITIQAEGNDNDHFKTLVEDAHAKMNDANIPFPLQGFLSRIELVLTELLNLRSYKQDLMAERDAVVLRLHDSAKRAERAETEHVAEIGAWKNKAEVAERAATRAEDQLRMCQDRPALLAQIARQAEEMENLRRERNNIMDKVRDFADTLAFALKQRDAAWDEVRALQGGRDPR